MTNLIQQLGALAYPLLFCSLVTVTLIGERLLHFITLPNINPNRTRHLFERLSPQRPTTSDSLPTAIIEPATELQQGMLWEGTKLLLNNAQQSPAIREEIIGLWLTDRQTDLRAHIRWLTVVAVVSPLLGLLGTVSGLVMAFKDLSMISGPIQPALLADGLQQAMLTTVVGLVIAIPALVAAHGFGIWGDGYLARVISHLGQLNLALKGVETTFSKSANDPTDQPISASVQAAN